MDSGVKGEVLKKKGVEVGKRLNSMFGTVYVRKLWDFLSFRKSLVSGRSLNLWMQ